MVFARLGPHIDGISDHYQRAIPDSASCGDLGQAYQKPCSSCFITIEYPV